MPVRGAFYSTSPRRVFFFPILPQFYSAVYPFPQISRQKRHKRHFFKTRLRFYPQEPTFPLWFFDLRNLKNIPLFFDGSVCRLLLYAPFVKNFTIFCNQTVNFWRELCFKVKFCLYFCAPCGHFWTWRGENSSFSKKILLKQYKTINGGRYLYWTGKARLYI